jgi:hypothetical protein
MVYILKFFPLKVLNSLQKNRIKFYNLIIIIYLFKKIKMHDFYFFYGSRNDKKWSFPYINHMYDWDFI